MLNLIFFTFSSILRSPVLLNPSCPKNRNALSTSPSLLPAVFVSILTSVKWRPGLVKSLLYHNSEAQRDRNRGLPRPQMAENSSRLKWTQSAMTIRPTCT